mgnify:CR=1 FL=1
MIEQLRAWADSLDNVPFNTPETVGIVAGMRDVANDLERDAKVNTMDLKEMAAYITNTCADNDKHEDELNFTIGVRLDTIIYIAFANGDSMGAVELKEYLCEMNNKEVGTDDDGPLSSATWELNDLNPPTKNSFCLEYRYRVGDSCAYDAHDITGKERVLIRKLLDLWRPEEGYEAGSEIVIQPEATDGTE